MAKSTGIQWTDATWNIAVGCTKVDEDCKFCYMYRQSLDSTRYDPKTVRKTKTVFNLPLRIKEPSKIFTSSLTDFFHEAIDHFRAEAWEIIKKCPQHTFQILTKRPERIMANLPEDWNNGFNYPNVWLGTSVGSDDSIKRIDQLIAVPCLTRFVSFEPLWGQVSPFDISTLCEINWVIIGGESGNENGKYRYRPCEIEWIEEIVKDFKVTTKIFIKQLGTHLSKKFGLKDRHAGDMEEWPESLAHLKIREFP
jgi:protein gp37